MYLTISSSASCNFTNKNCILYNNKIPKIQLSIIEKKVEIRTNINNINSNRHIFTLVSSTTNLFSDGSSCSSDRIGVSKTSFSSFDQVDSSSFFSSSKLISSGKYA